MVALVALRRGHVDLGVLGSAYRVAASFHSETCPSSQREEGYPGQKVQIQNCRAGLVQRAEEWPFVFFGDRSWT
jgi:hypothetical protein